MTGHENGIITLALGEADDAEREYRRTKFGEPYRTLLGHFRHEIGHLYWDLLVGRDPVLLDKFRALFGDERLDYAEALNRHYTNGAPADWQAGYISAYATSHPWEDFAETWAHYFHLVDTLEMASAFGLKLEPTGDAHHELTATMDLKSHGSVSVPALIERWLPLSSLLNNLNRTVGQPDAYPFVLTPPVIEKLGFVERIIGAAGTGEDRDLPEESPAQGTAAPPQLPGS